MNEGEYTDKWYEGIAIGGKFEGLVLKRSGLGLAYDEMIDGYRWCNSPYLKEYEGYWLHKDIEPIDVIDYLVNRVVYLREVIDAKLELEGRTCLL